MDIMMPVKDGLEATREIRAQASLAGLPIIAITAKAMADDRRQCLEAGANDYIAKPIDIERLVSLCRVWLAK
jgi:CheY-like chemotaxis protein